MAFYFKISSWSFIYFMGICEYFCQKSRIILYESFDSFVLLFIIIWIIDGLLLKFLVIYSICWSFSKWRFLHGSYSYVIIYSLFYILLVYLVRSLQSSMHFLISRKIFLSVFSFLTSLILCLISIISRSFGFSYTFLVLVLLFLDSLVGPAMISNMMHQRKKNVWLFSIYDV